MLSSNNQVLYEIDKLEEADRNRRLPLRAIVDRPLPDTEYVSLGLALTPGRTRMRVRHPYISDTSWIRVMPEPGTTVLTMPRGDSIRSEIQGYVNVDPVGKSKLYKEGSLLYRTLDTGEIEVMSSGRAYLFFGNLGDVEMRGGSIRHDLRQSQLDTQSISPTYNRRLHLAAPAKLAHEERFGVIKRPDQQRPNLIQQYVRTSDDKFATEYSRWLNTSDGTPLISNQEGYVVDAMGQFGMQASTNKTLRQQKKWYHKKTGDLTFEVDEELNLLFTNSTKATETKVDLGAKNVLKLSAQDIKFTLLKTGVFQFGTSATTKAQTIATSATKSYKCTTPQFRVNSADVGFGATPSIPIALAPGVSAVLNPALATLQGFLQVMATDPTFVPAFPAVATAAQSAAAAVGAAVGSLSQMASTQVKVSG